MTELDFLAWLIIGAATIFIGFPVILCACGADYWQAVYSGVLLILFLVLAAAVVDSIFWAVSYVI